MQTVSVLRMTLRRVRVSPTKIVFIDTGSAMQDTFCAGHGGDIGPENPKASISVGDEVYLLCKSCWTAQGLEPKVIFSR